MVMQRSFGRTSFRAFQNLLRETQTCVWWNDYSCPVTTCQETPLYIATVSAAEYAPCTLHPNLSVINNH